MNNPRGIISHWSCWQRIHPSVLHSSARQRTCGTSCSPGEASPAAVRLMCLQTVADVTRLLRVCPAKLESPVRGSLDCWKLNYSLRESAHLLPLQLVGVVSKSCVIKPESWHHRTAALRVTPTIPQRSGGVGKPADLGSVVLAVQGM